MREHLRLSTGLLLPLLLLPLPAQEAGEVGKAGDAGEWQTTAGELGLSPADIAQLGRDKLLLSNQAWKAVFDAYLGSPEGTSSFITSDSLLNAFHSLFEESILTLERARAIELPGILRRLHAILLETGGRLLGSRALLPKARRRMSLVLAVALKLLDAELPELDQEATALVEREAARITRAQGSHAPTWLGPFDSDFVGIDYSRFKPRGPYAAGPLLRRYFRAVSWLQAVPFRVDQDAELLGMCLLGRGMHVSRDFDAIWRLQRYFQVFEDLLGKKDDWDLATAYACTGPILLSSHSVEGLLARIRKDLAQLTATEMPEQINDRLRYPPDKKKPPPRVFFLFSAHRTPESLLFFRTTTLLPGRPFPRGLELAAILGSPVAARFLQKDEPAALFEQLAKGEELLAGESLYAGYLRCLSMLFDAPDPAAPELFAGAAWQLKSCNSALAAWAQARHTMALQAKRSANYLCRTSAPKALVEPDPMFFSHLAAHAGRCRSLLSEHGALSSGSTRMAVALTELLLAIERVESFDSPRLFASDLGFSSGGDLTEFLLALVGSEPAKTGKRTLPPKPQCIDALRRAIRHVARTRSLPPGVNGACLDKIGPDLRGLWLSFELTCRRLEALAHKQLRGMSPTRSEEEFLTDYGKTLARFFFYEGNSYVIPRDDAPKCVDIHTHPLSGVHLHVAVARPRSLYLLYPWKGKTLLCRGAVLPYYEFKSSQRLTDSEWKARCDAKTRPAPPTWLTPLLGEEGLTRPALKK